MVTLAPSIAIMSRSAGNGDDLNRAMPVKLSAGLAMVRRTSEIF
jgi:hypothetical protein